MLFGQATGREEDMYANRNQDTAECEFCGKKKRERKVGL
jgi:hypothetical protein